MRACRYIGVILLCMASVACLGCTGQKTSPSEIIGVWATDHADHEGESMEFTSSRLIMSSSEDVYENSIVEIKSSKGHLYNTTLYTIRFLDSDGVENLLNVIYSPEDGGTLRLKALQDVLWSRQ